MQEQTLYAWLSLSLSPGISALKLHGYLEYFHSPLELIANRALAEVPVHLKHELKELRQKIAHKSTQEKVKQVLTWREKANNHVIAFDSNLYPPLLKEITDPPMLLYVKGKVECLDLPQIALVGSRKPTPGGREFARTLAGDMSRAGYCISSGLALGIDTQAHQGALEVGGQSIAVMGCGLDQVYPPANRRLCEKLSEEGAVVSEFSLGSVPKAWHFPQRNRIISGLSQGVVVIEAADKSGSLITARFALEQGREVFAVPGSPFNLMAKGSNALIKQGATLVETAEDVLVELGAFKMAASSIPEAGRQSLTQLSEKARELLMHLDQNPASIDLLIQRSGFSAEQIMAILVELEIQGLIDAEAGSYALSPQRA